MGVTPAKMNGNTDGICDDCYKLFDKEIIEFRKNKAESIFSNKSLDNLSSE